MRYEMPLCVDTTAPLCLPAVRRSSPARASEWTSRRSGGGVGGVAVGRSGGSTRPVFVARREQQNERTAREKWGGGNAITHCRITLIFIFISPRILQHDSSRTWVASFTAIQLQISQNCCLHTYTTDIGVMVSANILSERLEYSTPVSGPIPDNGTGA